jgi:transcriptional regulator with XRE-family HTH domain
MYPNLKLQLWRSGLRQNRLAQMLEVDETTLSRIVNGFREPTPDLRRNIAHVLACDPEWLFEPEPNPQPVERVESAVAFAKKPATEGK